MSYNEGDVVRLKSGGPQMTVSGIIGPDSPLRMLKMQGFDDGDVTVQYFDGGKLVNATFKQTVIELCSD
ncbi:DUF2158 domain-containing protein [Paraburkholderia sp. IMGN_8]|uniref:YodC family protein n=1 Tax=Paraburkholderia sp. IMGN_8 TaxID=3136564 RepID=UPI0031019FB7